MQVYRINEWTSLLCVSTLKEFMVKYSRLKLNLISETLDRSTSLQFSKCINLYRLGVI